MHTYTTTQFNILLEFKNVLLDVKPSIEYKFSYDLLKKPIFFFFKFFYILCVREKAKTKSQKNKNSN